ncbi:DUF2334 domain-containing protein, partial [Candidatus Woesearchaeota archaeon]|nr:DUF2334 domain-containing protein [Candidatus Woesearchaeota archaeon]
MVEIPRFQHDTEKQIVRELAVLYTPDDLDAKTTLDELGFPDKNIFLLHKEHPKLKMTMFTIPAAGIIRNEEFRYIFNTTKEKNYSGICCASLWRMIMYNETFMPWMELGNHGYSHEAPGDTNLSHHEFSATQSGCNFNHSLANTIEYCDQRYKLAREAYEKTGLDNDKILVAHFPGWAYTEAALRALLDNNFIAFFDTGFDWTTREQYCKESWVQLSDGREILSIPNTVNYFDFYDHPSSKSNIDKCAKNGGIISFTNHWWRAPPENRKEYYIFNGTLTYIEQKY